MARRCGQCVATRRRWLAVDAWTGECLVRNPDGSCREFRSSAAATAAGEATDSEHPGVRMRIL